MRKLVIALAAALVVPAAHAQNTVKIGIVTFLSGPAAAPFGVPARNAAEFVVDELNAGKAPAPYGKKGFGGSTIETVILDEAGSTTTQVTEFRNLVQRQNVDPVIGYVSSGNCLSSVWDGDFEALILQGGPRGLMKTSMTILTTGETAMHKLGAQIPDGTVLGARGPFGPYAPDNQYNKWFGGGFEKRYSSQPNYASYQMAQAILGVKMAWEKAMEKNGGKRPSNEDVGAALEHATFEGPGGPVPLAIGKGHQAIMETAYRQTRFVNGKLTLCNVKRYPAEKVNPTERPKSPH